MGLCYTVAWAPRYIKLGITSNYVLPILKAKMKTLFFSIILLLLSCTCAIAQEYVQYSSTDAGGNAVEVTAVLSVPKKSGTVGQKSAAVVLFHSVGGWENPVTAQYATALSEAGFVVLEPRLFANKASAPPGGPLANLPMAYDALRYLATRDDVDAQRIGVAGFSYGGMLALHSAASWAQVKYGKDANLRFAAHAPFYPLCWVFSDLAKGKRTPAGFPVEALKQWTGAPIKIFAGGRDDYDGKDPNACTEFISYLPATQQAAFSVQVYPEATHGWDQKSATFYEKLACKGHGCTNVNEANPVITQQGINALIEYFAKTLAKIRQ